MNPTKNKGPVGQGIYIYANSLTAAKLETRWQIFLLQRPGCFESEQRSKCNQLHVAAKGKANHSNCNQRKLVEEHLNLQPSNSAKGAEGDVGQRQQEPLKVQSTLS